MQPYTLNLFLFCAVVATAYCVKQVKRPCRRWGCKRGLVVDGLGGVKQADAEVRKAVIAVAKELATHTKSAANTKFEPIEYLTQTVAGTNYFVKIRSGAARPDAPFYLARIYQNIDGKYRLDGVMKIKDSDNAAYMDGNIDD